MNVAAIQSGAAPDIATRVERLPFSAWHLRIMGLLGTATFFDAFDALALAFVLPALIGPWQLTPTQIGLTIAVGYAGQLIGALTLGKYADRHGRRVTLVYAVALMSIMSIACALATSLPMLMAARLLQGIGLGAEVPIAAIYLNELAPARIRGRVILLFQTVFAVGVAVTAVAALWIVPHLGWRWMFALGALPLLLLPLMLRRVPESPRWLAEAGRSEEAEREMQRIEIAVGVPVSAPSPPLVRRAQPAARQPTFRNLLQGAYRRRTLTVWAILFCTSAVGYGLLTWLPSLYRTSFHLPVEQSLKYGMIISLTSPIGSLLGALLIDRLGRKTCFAGAFIGAALPLLLLWRMAGQADAATTLWLAAFACLSISILLAGIYVYAPEVYPTYLRGLGVGTGTSFYRLAAIVSPTVIGLLLQTGGLASVFFALCVVAAIGALVVVLFAMETRGRRLEELEA